VAGREAFAIPRSIHPQPHTAVEVLFAVMRPELKKASEFLGDEELEVSGGKLGAGRSVTCGRYLENVPASTSSEW
jgi:hypothetical protein